MKRLSFSIIIPTYQRRDLVCETIRALGKLKYKGRVDIVVVVDGSRDGTAAALAKVECPFPLQVIEQRNSGAGAARNRGAAVCEGEILLFLDDDMICDANLLEEHARCYRDGADAVIGDFTEPGRNFGVLSELLAERTVSGGIDACLTPFDIFGGQISMRRGVFNALGGFDESFTADGRYGYEDFDLGYRLLQRQFVIRHNPSAISRHQALPGAHEYMRRGRRCAEAELHLVGKHPELAPRLLEWTGELRISKRLRLLCRIPFVTRIAAEIAATTAQIGARTLGRSSPKLSYLRNAAFSLAYWSTLERNGQNSSL